MFKRIAFITLGIMSLILGIVGIVLPVLPTTPFLLLSSYLFLRSSDSLYNWLIDHPVLGFYIKSYIKYRAVERKSKIIAILLLWTTMGISNYLVDKSFVKVILLLIGLGVTTHILMLKTLTPELIEEHRRSLGKETEN